MRKLVAQNTCYNGETVTFSDVRFNKVRVSYIWEVGSSTTPNIFDQIIQIDSPSYSGLTEDVVSLSCLEEYKKTGEFQRLSYPAVLQNNPVSVQAGNYKVFFYEFGLAETDFIKIRAAKLSNINYINIELYQDDSFVYPIYKLVGNCTQQKETQFHFVEKKQISAYLSYLDFSLYNVGKIETDNGVFDFLSINNTYGYTLASYNPMFYDLGFTQNATIYYEGRSETLKLYEIIY